MTKSVKKEIRPGVTMTLTGPDVEESDLLFAELLYQIAAERGTAELEITEEVAEEIIARGRKRGYDFAKNVSLQ